MHFCVNENNFNSIKTVLDTIMSVFLLFSNISCGPLTRSSIFKLSKSLQLRFLRRWASSMMTQRQAISLNSGQSDSTISKVVMRASNLYAPGIKCSCTQNHDFHYTCDEHITKNTQNKSLAIITNNFTFSSLQYISYCCIICRLARLPW